MSGPISWPVSPQLASRWASGTQDLWRQLDSDFLPPSSTPRPGPDPAVITFVQFRPISDQPTPIPGLTTQFTTHMWHQGPDTERAVWVLLQPPPLFREPRLAAQPLPLAQKARASD